MLNKEVELPEFNPDKVTLCFFGNCSYESYWITGEQFPSGWGEERDARKSSHVDTRDYDALRCLWRDAHDQIEILTSQRVKIDWFTFLAGAAVGIVVGVLIKIGIFYLGN